MRKLQFCLVVFAVLTLTFSAVAQVTNGQFSGTVLDPTGAAVSGAKITVANQGTNLSVSTTTNSSGNYTARELPVGTYKLTAEAAGFKTVSDNNVVLNAGVIAHVDFKLQLGKASEVVEVTGAAAQVNTEDSKLATTVGAEQVASLPLNGRNVFDLIQMQPGAVSVKNVLSENGHDTVVNGLRENFNGFLLDGLSNKDLSGGVVNTPIQDTVEEFQMLTLNMSAQYGNSAGSVTNVVSKSGTNAWHGSAFEFIRNDALDANNFFLNQGNVKRPPLRFNQFGGTFGGAIIKDKLFFFAAYQGDRFLTSQQPGVTTVESQAWRDAVHAANPTSVADLLYQNFKPSVDTGAVTNLTDYVTGGGSASGNKVFGAFLCADFLSASHTQGLAMAQRLANVIGVTAADIAYLQDAGNGCGNGTQFSTPFTGTFDRVNSAFLDGTVVLANSRAQNNLFHGNEGSLRIDWTASSKDRVGISFNSQRSSDEFNSGGLNQSARGFFGPVKNWDPNFRFSLLHTFSPTVLNEFRAGYAATIQGFSAGNPGVPQIYFGDLTLGFGAYSGYPQTFHDNIYSYSDMVSITHGNHNIKVGGDLRRNIENSQFSVGRPYYYFYDPILFAADAPASEAAGVDPGLASNPSAPVAQLAENKRHFRNWEVGIYGQDDWKVNHRLTLNLGLRYDLFTRHTEEGNKATVFIPGPGVGFVDQVTNANQFFGTGTCIQPVNEFNSIMAGECGPGGFAASKSLSTGDHNNFGPRVGFAWDVFGTGKTSIRGGFGVAYEGTFYNALSNSRWNPPFYSFNNAAGSQAGNNQLPVYGPQTPGAVPSFTGPADPLNHQGVGIQATGNINGWDPTNLNQAVRTGIVFNNLRDPYVYNFFYSIQHEIIPKMTLEANYVGTVGHKLFRAENINRDDGGRLPLGLTMTDNLGRTVTGRADFTTNTVDPSKQINPTGKANPNYGNLRSWLNVVNSNYSALQLSLKDRGFHGVQFNLDYTYSHAIDDGSTWHSGATSSNGAAAGEGYTSDVRAPGLDRGNSIFDIRHRIVANFVWDLPILRGSHTLMGKIAGGWQYNGIFSYQTGAHWSPFTASPRAFVATAAGFADTDCKVAATFVAAGCVNVGGDYNLDGVANDRPDAQAKNVHATHDMWANGWGASKYDINKPGATFFSIPCGGVGPCQGNLGRNTFVGPGYFDMDMSLFKNFRITEKVNVQFRTEGFNVLNHTNFALPGASAAGHNKITDKNFGLAGTVFDPRQIQFGLKINF